jgi:hypothetical protein
MPEQLASVPKNGNKRPNGQQKPDGETSESSTKTSPDKFADGHDFLIINSPMEEDVFTKLIGCVSSRKAKTNKNLVLTLVTYGGSADAAYRIGRYLQSVYDNITVFIPSSCKSAGTLLAIAGHSIVMSPFGELGPLDVQLRQKDEIFARRSGLDTRSALEDLRTHTFELFEHFMLGIIDHSGGSISFKVAADISARTASDIVGKIYEQINSDSLGQDFRYLNVATKYCERLNKRGGNIKETGIQRLIHEYPSHDFVIDAEEAKEIFNEVDNPSGTLYRFMLDNLYDLMRPKTRKDAVIRMVDVNVVEEEKYDAKKQPRPNVATANSTSGNGSGEAATS